MAGKNNKKVHRAFLNKNEGVALCQTSVEWSHYGNSWTIDADVNISDCNRIATLCFWACDRKEANRMLEKCDKLIAMLTQFRNEYETAITTMENTSANEKDR